MAKTRFRVDATAAVVPPAKRGRMLSSAAPFGARKEGTRFFRSGEAGAGGGKKGSRKGKKRPS